jgi:hypothetical protein
MVAGAATPSATEPGSLPIVLVPSGRPDLVVRH